MRSDGYYLKLENEFHRNPIQADFGPGWSVANPGGFRAYVTMSRYSPGHTIHKITDLYGRERVLNDIGWKVMCQTLLYIAGGTETSTKDLARKIGCCKQTVLRWVTKLTAWGVIGSIMVRGKFGGAHLFARRIGDNLDRFAAIARAKLDRIRARNLKSHPHDTGREQSYYLASNKGVTLDFGDPFARRQRIMDALNIDNSRRSGMLRCPAHEDKRQSLSFKITADGKLLLHCFAGCTYQEIVKAVL